ncbi:MAG TPA: hypothetical protein VEX69_08085 [Candidatus Limnocylindria bacterium]|nr:hypothetical protein [Candidatus Limnocylindria bacterium]
MKRALLVGLFALSAGLFAQDKIPAGTILPVRLNISLNSAKTKPGQVITARVMQDVPLESGMKVHAGSKLAGHLVDVTPARNGAAGKISFQFDKLMVSKETIAVVANLRALASPLEVEQAQLPYWSPDRGTPSTVWTTVQIGGDEIVYRGGGHVSNGERTVGEPVPDGVLARVSAKTGTECRGAVEGNDRPQAVWVFGSDVCGTFGYPRVNITHAGRTNPVGEIVLTSTDGDVNVRSGSGMLLRVNSASR